MAKRIPSRKKVPEKKSKTKAVHIATPIGWDRANYAIMGVGILVIAVGFATLARGSITLAPFLLVSGYCVLLPLGIVWSTKSWQNAISWAGGRRKKKPEASSSGTPGS